MTLAHGIAAFGAVASLITGLVMGYALGRRAQIDDVWAGVLHRLKIITRETERDRDLALAKLKTIGLELGAPDLPELHGKEFETRAMQLGNLLRVARARASA